ncbi:MAG: cytochrome c peroxidase [Thiomicrorhabdus sp.]|nr:MAG: cytochrome c peroxidase [Thiomicrorhabdus sp.]
MKKNVSKPLGIISLFLVSTLLIGCQEDSESYLNFSKTIEEPILTGLSTEKSRVKYHQPLPDIKDLNLNPKKIDLGNMLYHDTRLSGDGTLSCASCHVYSEGGDDNAAVSTGINGQLGPINSPSTLNSGLSFKQFWDGRAASLRLQAEGPVANPGEMGAKWPNVVARIQTVDQYQDLFKNIYPIQGISKYTITDAIAEFERSLMTPAPVDAYLRGDDSALTANQIEGYGLFQSYGCVSCHQGAGFGGNMMQKFGAISAFFSEKDQSFVNNGRFNLTNNEEDKHVFKVPSLRNVELTAPYFHTGGTKTLDQAITVMGLNQLGRLIPKEDRAKIADFLTSLTGVVNIKPVSPPPLVTSTDNSQH